MRILPSDGKLVELNSSGKNESTANLRVLLQEVADGTLVKGSIRAITADAVVIALRDFGAGVDVKVGRGQIPSAEVGQSLLFEVVTDGPSGSQKLLKLDVSSLSSKVGISSVLEPTTAAQNQGVGGSSALIEEMSRLKIPLTPRNLSIYTAQREQGLPPTKEAFVQLQAQHFFVAQVSKNTDQWRQLAPELDWSLGPKEFSQAVDHLLKVTTSLSISQSDLAKTSVVDPTHQIAITSMTIQPGTLERDQSKSVTLPVLVQDQEPVLSQVQNTNKDISPKALSTEVPAASEGFFEGLTKVIAQLGTETQVLSNTLAFMKHQNLSTGMLDIALVKSLMTGQLGSVEGLLEILDNWPLNRDDLKAIDHLVNQIKERTLSWGKDLNTLQGQEIKALTEAVAGLKAAVSTWQLQSETKEVEAQFGAIDQLNRVQEATTNWTMMAFPVQMQGQLSDIEIYVKGDGKKNKVFDESNGLIYIVLQTDYLDVVRAKIDSKKEILKITLMAANDRVAEFFKAYEGELLSAVQGLTEKNVSIMIEKRNEPLDLAGLEKVDLNHSHIFDILV